MTTQELINQTKQLIAIRSTADNPEGLSQAVDFVEQLVRKVPGITVEHFERNGRPSFLAYRGSERPEKFDILLNGHVDVVPGKPSLFKAHEKDGKLYGRGALDMKGTTLTLTDAFCELVNDLPYNLGLQIVSDEEIGGYDGVRMHIDDYGVRADFVVIGEYANHRNTIYNAARGLCWAEIAFRGKSAHGGHLWNGTNAVLRAGEFAGALLKRYPTPDRETWTTTASISDLSTTNDAFNKVPDWAVLKIDFRFTQEDPVFESRESLIAFIHELDPEAELINTHTFEPAVFVEELNPYVQGLSSALQAATGEPTNFLGRPAGSDGRHFALVNNDVVEFGLYGLGPHSDQEYVELASFGEYQQALRNFLRKPIPDNPAERLEQPGQPIYVWYATYGSGLVKENLLQYIKGGKTPGTLVSVEGCRDKTPPLKDVFTSLPYKLYFSGQSKMWGGGFARIEPVRNPEAHTIARMHLITLEQFEDIYTQMNRRGRLPRLALKTALRHGHATIDDGTKDYDALLFCGMRDGHPILTLTAAQVRTPYTEPSEVYMRHLCQGLSEATNVDTDEGIHRLLEAPGLRNSQTSKQVETTLKKPK